MVQEVDNDVISVAVPVSQLGPGALSLDLIAQHCTLLPPELVSLPPGIPGAPGHQGLLTPATATTFISQEQDIVNNNIADTGMDFNPVHIKEVRGAEYLGAHFGYNLI